MKALIQMCLLAAAAVTAAQASLVLTWDNPHQTALPGDTVKYFGTISNDGDPENVDDTIFLNFYDLNFDGAPGLTATPFFENTNASFAGGESQTGVELLDIVVTDPFTDPFTTYSGTFVLKGGADSDAMDPLTGPEFSLTVQQPDSGVPEPASFLLLGAGLVALGFKARSARACM